MNTRTKLLAALLAASMLFALGSMMLAAAIPAIRG